MTSNTDGSRLFQDCVVKAQQRPDGTMLISVSHEGHLYERTVDSSRSLSDVVRSIKFDVLSEANDGSMVGAVDNYCSRSLPTYANKPIHETRYARMWALRKLAGY